MFKVPEKFRVTTGQGRSDESYGNNGCFIVRSMKLTYPLRVIASDGEGWEHVSISLPNRCPTWGEMSLIKNLFWGDDDMVIQFHPPKSEYINCHPFCLHLWRRTGRNDFCDLPPKILVGPA